MNSGVSASERELLRRPMWNTFVWIFSLLIPHRCSHGVLRWTGQPVPAPRLLPRAAHQHDRGEGRPGDSGYSWSPTQFRARMPAPLAPVHRQRPQTHGPQHGHRVPHEEAAARGGGSGAGQPALVLLGPAAGWQNETGGAENPKGLRGASHREPALSKSHPGGKLISACLLILLSSVSVVGFVFAALSSFGLSC